MEEKFKYGSYAILFLNIVLFSMILKSVKGYLLIGESIIFSIVFLLSIYLVYSSDNGKSNDIFFLTLFVFSTINALVLFLMIHGFYSISLSILNLIGMYVVIFSIPEKREARNKNPSNEVDTAYVTGKSDELKKNFEKENLRSQDTHYLPNEEKDVKDELLDEAEIVIEEIKPISDISKDKKAKKNKPKKR